MSLSSVYNAVNEINEKNLLPTTSQIPFTTRHVLILFAQTSKAVNL